MTYKIDIDFEKVIEIFNSSGKESAKEYIWETYGVKYDFVQRQIYKQTSYIFNKSTRKYELSDKPNEPFLSMDELCNKSIEPSINEDNYSKEVNNPYDLEFQNLIVDMMKDRLCELTKFISIDQGRKNIVINLKSLETNGYNLKVL